MYHNILVPHAGTPAEDEALKHAIHAAKGTNAKIIILHIVEEIQRPRLFALSSDEREKLLKSINGANESIKDEMKVEMDKRTQQCKNENIETEIKVLVGDAAEIIFDIIDKEKIDLVVIARRRKSKTIRKLTSLGSVSRKVVENASCPVLLIET